MGYNSCRVAGAYIYNGIANYDIIDIIKIQNFDISLIEYFYDYQSSLIK